MNSRGICRVSCLALSLARMSRSERALWSALGRAWRLLLLRGLLRVEIESEEDDEDDEREEDDEFPRAQREMASSTTAAIAPSPEAALEDEEELLELGVFERDSSGFWSKCCPR